MTDFDVIVVGAGVAGSATAIEAAARGYHVALLHHPKTRASWESLPPWGSRELSRLSIDLGTAIERVVAWWDSEREQVAHYPDACVLEGSELARRLRERAQTAGVAVLRSDGRFSLARSPDGWRLQGLDAVSRAHNHLTSHHVVDATGRSAALGRRLGARRVGYDRLVSLSVAIRPCGVAGTWTETMAFGWWNVCSSGLQGTATFTASPATIRHARGRLRDAFGQTAHLSELFELAEVHPVLRPSGSSCLLPCAGPGWWAVGDAAWTAQPLASCGIAKSLADAHQFSIAVSQAATYDLLQSERFKRYLRELKSQYDSGRSAANASSTTLTRNGPDHEDRLLPEPQDRGRNRGRTT
jgi:flavin-dependent dehydrogenase